MNQLKIVSNFHLVFLLFVISSVAIPIAYVLEYVLNTEGEISSLLVGAVATFVGVYVAAKIIRKQYLLTGGNVRKIIRWFIGIKFISGLAGAFVGTVGIMGIMTFGFAGSSGVGVMNLFTFTNPIFTSFLVTGVVAIVVSYFAIKMSLTPNENHST